VTELLDAAAIEAAMDQLYAHQLAPGYARARSELMKELDARLPGCIAPMLAIGERRLDELSNSPQDANRINHSLHVIFDFFEGRRLAQVRPLIERALQNNLFNMKEQYIQTLEQFGDPASLAALASLLRLHRSNNVEDEGVRAAVLGALTGYFPALRDPSPVVDQLGDESLRVRRGAIRYLSAHAVRTTDAALAIRAMEEEDPDLLADVLVLLAQTNQAKALAVAEERLASTPVSDKEIIEQLQLSLEALRAQPH
jgi:hypothetical protein